MERKREQGRISEEVHAGEAVIVKPAEDSPGRDHPRKQLSLNYRSLTGGLPRVT